MLSVCCQYVVSVLSETFLVRAVESFKIQDRAFSLSPYYF